MTSAAPVKWNRNNSSPRKMIAMTTAKIGIRFKKIVALLGPMDLKPVMH